MSWKTFRSERGQTASEYMGILLLVAVIIGALVQTGVAGKIANGATDMVQAIAGGGKDNPNGSGNPGGRATPAVPAIPAAPATLAAPAIPAAPATPAAAAIPAAPATPAASPTRRRRRSSA